MRKFVTLIALLIIGISLQAQVKCDCQPELEFVYEQVQKSASFKSQIKGEKLDAFEKNYQRLNLELMEEVDMMECFWKLNQLLDPIRDKHMSVYGTRPNFGLKEARDSVFVAQYRKSEAFIKHPHIDMDLEELKERLSSLSLESVEGIYNIGSAMKLGVFKAQGNRKLKTMYYGVILESKLGIWEPGQIMLMMEPNGRDNEFDILAFGQVQKNMMFAKGQLYQFGHLFSNVVKERQEVRYSRVKHKSTKAFELRSINEEVQYFWLDDLGRYKKETQRDALIAQINKELVAPNLIVDLRDNGGGASKISIPILRALKKKPGTRIYVLTNFFSGSNAEQTTVRLKKIKGTVHLGQRTFGAIAYGKNYGYSYDSPSGLFTFSPTDMKFNHFLKYEEVGVTPDVVLNNESDWIEQTLDIINGQNL